METICEYEKCTGCFACQNVCPHKCIKLVSDKFGELHPQINVLSGQNLNGKFP